jgi:hypothetical protein
MRQRNDATRVRPDLLRSRLEAIIDVGHALVKLARTIAKFLTQLDGEWNSDPPIKDIG